MTYTRPERIAPAGSADDVAGGTRVVATDSDALRRDGRYDGGPIVSP